MWIDIVTKEIVRWQGGIRELRPNVSAPFVLTDEMISDLGFAPVIQTPPNNTEYQTATEGPVVENLDGTYSQTWILTDIIDPVQLAALLPTEQDYTNALTLMFDAKAQERRYDDRITCALRAGYDGPFHDEGLAYAQWMDTCNALAYQTMADIAAGTTNHLSIAEFLAIMPEFTWPAE